MTRRPPRWKALAIAFSTLVVLAATTGPEAPIGMTEASWTDNVNASASFTASEHAGVNYARAAASNGTMNRTFIDSAIPGAVSAVDNTALPGDFNTGDIEFDTAGFLDFVYFESDSRSCARVNSTLCLGDPAGPPTVPAFAESAFNSMEIRTSKGALGSTIAEYTGGTSDAIKTSASCSVGNNGVPGVSRGAGVRLRRGNNLALQPQFTTLTVPTVSGSSVNARGFILADTYNTTITYNAVSDKNYALSEVRMRIVATFVGLPSWTLDIVLSRAECGLSRPLSGGVVTAGMAATQMMTAQDMQLDATIDDAKTEEPVAEPPEEMPSEADTRSSPSPSSSRDARPSTEPSRSTSTTTTTTTASKQATTAPTATRTTTTTSASPVAAIPTAPGTLSSTAQNQTVGTVAVDGEELDVVVKGATVPSDAPTALPALDNWINEGTRPSGDWRTFTSSDPDADGWRWAAINRETGTVVYVR